MSSIFLRKFFTIFLHVTLRLTVPPRSVVFPNLFQLRVTVIRHIFLVAFLALVDMPVCHPRMLVEISEGFLNPALEAHLMALHGAS